MGIKAAKACERALIQALWDHTHKLWIFKNSEDHKNHNRTFAQYNQQTLAIIIAQQYETFKLNVLPLNILQQSHFKISQQELFLLSYDIRCAWLRSAGLYISQAAAYNDLAHGTHAQQILHNTSRPPPDTQARQYFLPHKLF
jgi:hypothetical protein